MKRLHHKSDVEIGVDKEVKEIQREWKHLKKFTDENHLLFMAFVILVAGLLIVNTTYILNRAAHTTTEHSPDATPNTTKILTSLDTAHNAGLSVKISNVTENDKTDYAFAAEPDTVMLLLDISITNNTTTDQQLIPVNQLYVRSNEGDYAPLHASMYATHPLSATELAPGKTASGQLSFSVPKRVANPLLYIDTTWDKTTPVVFDVLR